MRRRVVAVDPAAEDGDRRPARASAARCASPSIPRASPLTTTNQAPRPRPRAAGDGAPVAEHARAPTTASAAPARRASVRVAPEPQPRRGSGCDEERRVRRVAERERANRHAVTSRPPGGSERLGDVLGQDVVRPRERRDRSRDTRDSRASPARQREPVDRPVEELRRGGACDRARVGEPTARLQTRARTRSDGSPGPAASSSARGRGIATTRSKRSRSARETLSRYAAIRAACTAHSTGGRRVRRTGRCSSCRQGCLSGRQAHGCV